MVMPWPATYITACHISHTSGARGWAIRPASHSSMLEIDTKMFSVDVKTQNVSVVSNSFRFVGSLFHACGAATE